MHAVYVRTATLNFLHTPLHSDSMSHDLIFKPYLKQVLGGKCWVLPQTLNIRPHKTYIACIYLTLITSGKLLPDGDELWTE